MSNIYIVGYPKSGNTWLSRLVGDATNSPIKGNSLADEGHDRAGIYTIIPRHSRSLLDGGKIIVITRDPRDVIVSVKHYWQMDNIDLVFKPNHKQSVLDPTRGIKKFYELWFDEYKQYVDAYTSFEALKEDTDKELTSIFGKIGISGVNSNFIKRVTRRQSFNKRKKAIKINGDDLLYGKTIQLRNMRKGIVGDWKNHFKRKHGKIVHENLWEWMHRLGYEKDKSWWESLPE